MQARFRAAVAADIGALVDLENRSFVTDRLSGRSFRRLISSPAASVIVAGAGRAIAGYAVVLFRAGAKVARLYSLAVDPDHRGLGRDLLAAAESAARSRGCRALRLEVRDDNARAIDLYVRSGYRRFGERPDYYADGANALRFEKPFSASDERAHAAGAAAA